MKTYVTPFPARTALSFSFIQHSLSKVLLRLALAGIDSVPLRVLSSRQVICEGIRTGADELALSSPHPIRSRRNVDDLGVHRDMINRRGTVENSSRAP